MVYFLDGMISDLVGTAITTGIHNSRERAATAHWYSPLSRLGRCGIFSLRAWEARDLVLRAVSDAGLDTCQVAYDLRLPGTNIGQILAAGPQGVAVVESLIGDDHITAVRRAGDASLALSTLAGEDFPVYAFVCRAELEEEPRQLPGPSGNPVTVTGLPWLSGLLRRQLAYSTVDRPLPDRLDLPLVAAQWRADHQRLLASRAVRQLPPQWWWLIEDLYLDDRNPGTADLVVAGPGGVFVIDFSMTGDDDAVARVCLQAGRLRGYLPHVDVLPMIVSESVTTTRYGPNDPAGYPVAWLNPSHALAFIEGTRRRGLATHEIGILNTPAPGWIRRVTVEPSGEIVTYFQGR